MARLLEITLAVCCALSFTGWALAEEQPTGITVQGHGQVEVMPDATTVTASVEQTASSVPELRGQLSNRISHVIAAEKALGFSGLEMQTTQFSVYPVYPSNVSRKPMTKPAGYKGNASLRITLKHLQSADLTTDAARLTDAAMANGADSVQGAQFFLDDPSVAAKQALDKAVQEAKEIAQTVSHAAGITLGPLQLLQIGSYGYGVPMLAGAQFERANAVMAAPVSPDVFQVAPQQISRDVTLRYGIGL